MIWVNCFLMTDNVFDDFDMFLSRESYCRMKLRVRFTSNNVQWFWKQHERMTRSWLQFNNHRLWLNFWLSFLIFINDIYELCNIKIIDDHLRENINDIKLKLVSHFFFFWKCEKKLLISLKLTIFKYSSQLTMKLCSR